MLPRHEWTPRILWVALLLPFGSLPAPALPKDPERFDPRIQEAFQRGEEPRVLIAMHPQADPRSVRSEATIDAVLQGISARQVRPERRLVSAPVLVARVTEEGFRGLLADPRVSRIDLDGIVHGAALTSTEQIGADRVQALGFDGTGVAVAVLDTGTDPAPNPNLDSSLVAEECFCSLDGGCCPDGSSRQSGPGSARGINSHGVASFGVISGDGQYPSTDGPVPPIGVAPGAGVVAVKVLDDALEGTMSDVLAALDWVVTSRPDVRAVNLSLSFGAFPADCDHLHAFTEAVAELSRVFRDRGGLFVAASGNNFDSDRIGSPACVGSVVSVGAVDAFDQVTGFSNTGPGLDLLAPGKNILTTGIFGNLYLFTGTSAAAPHVTGAVALLLSANPSLSADEVEERLESRGVPVYDFRSGLTFPRVDAYAALLLPAKLSIFPPGFSRRTRGRELWARFQPSPPFRASDLDPSTLTLSLGGGAPVAAEAGGESLGDADGDGVEDLTVRFDRRQALRGLTAVGAVPVVVEGFFRTGLEIRGRTTLRIVGFGAGVSGSEPTP